MAKRPSNYAEKARDVAKYVTFKVTIRGKPTAAEKSRVNKYYRLLYGYKRRSDGEHIPGLAVGAKFPYRTKSTKILRLAQAYGSTRHNKYIKVAFVPWDGENKPKLRIKNGRVEDRQTFLTRRIIPFSEPLTLENVDEVVGEAIAREKGIQAFNVMSGDQGFEPMEKGFGTASPELTTDLVRQYMDKYDNEKDGHHYTEWLFGLVGYSFQNQTKFDDYKEHRKAHAKMLRRDRHNAWRRAQTVARNEAKKRAKNKR